MSTPLFELSEEIYENVYRGTYNGDRVIIKKYNKSKMSSSDLKHMEWELTALKNINTRYVIHRIDDTWREEDGAEYLYSIVEDISETLRFYIENFKNRQSIVKETAVHRFLVNILSGLRELHKVKKNGDIEERLIHRNINPDTVFLSNGGEFILGDLGLIKNIPTIPMGNGPNIQDGQTVLTMASEDTVNPDEVTYLAPETTTSSYDYKVDIWSVGCLLYEICALQPAFTLKDLINGEMNLQRRINNLKLPAEYSKDLDKIMRDMLCIDSKKRKSCDELFAEYKYLHNDSEIAIKSDNDFEELLVYNGEDKDVENIPKCVSTETSKPHEINNIDKIYTNEMKSQPNGLIIDDMMIFTKYEKASIADRNWFFPIDKSLKGEPYFKSPDDISSFQTNKTYMMKFESLVQNALKHMGYGMKYGYLKGERNHFTIFKTCVQSAEETAFIKRLLICMKLLHFNVLILFYKKLTYECKMSNRQWFLTNFKDILKDDDYYKTEFEEMKREMGI